jgi:hypothetical protein
MRPRAIALWVLLACSTVSEATRGHNTEQMAPVIDRDAPSEVRPAGNPGGGGGGFTCLGRGGAAAGRVQVLRHTSFALAPGLNARRSGRLQMESSGCPRSSRRRERGAERRPDHVRLSIRDRFQPSPEQRRGGGRKVHQIALMGPRLETQRGDGWGDQEGASPSAMTFVIGPLIHAHARASPRVEHGSRHREDRVL